MQGQRLCIGLTFKHKDKNIHKWNTLMTTNAQWENQQGKNVVQHVCIMHNTPLSGVVIASKCHNNDWVQTIKLSISIKSWMKKML